MRLLVIGTSGFFVGALAAWLAYHFVPPASEVNPSLDAGYVEGGEPPLPALRSSQDFIESTLIVRSPYQFCGDAETGDWCFTEEWDDGTTHTIRIHFTTVSAQGSVTQWVEDALLVKCERWMGEIA